MTKVTSKIKKLGKGKKALFYSDGRAARPAPRQVEVTFTDESGADGQGVRPGRQVLI